jgi:hypothetical protein
VSIHADEELNLRLALMSELEDVGPRDGLADLVITRYRKSRRRRIASVFGLFVVFAGIGVPIGVAGASGASGGEPARPGPVALRLGSYTLTLPGRYHLSDANAGPCSAGTRDAVAAVASPGVCVLMLLTPPGRSDPDVPRGAKQVTVGRYRAWLAPRGSAQAGDGTALIIEGESQDLVVGSAGLTQAGLVSLVSAGLNSAA